MVWLREISPCIQFPSNMWILKDFFGYRRMQANRSVLQLVKHYQNKYIVTLHIKIGYENPNRRFLPEIMIESMRKVYGNYGIGVFVQSTEFLTLPPHLLDVDIGFCFSLFETTDEQDELFTNLNFVPLHEVIDVPGAMTSDHIVIYFVRTTDPPKNGCAIHPYVPGAIVTGVASRWTLGHEVGHVLGLSHFEGILDDCAYDHLMTGCSTSNINVDPPILDDYEVEDMKEHSLAKECP